MRRLIFHMLLALGLLLGCFAGPGFAQRHRIEDEKPEKIRAPILPYFTAMVSTMIILVFVCTPTRRAYTQEEE